MPEHEIWRLFWAKTDRDKPDSGWTRPLWAHLLDVAHTALRLWDAFLPRALKKRIARDLGVSTRDAGRLLAFWIGLHDIGKAIPTFQELHLPSRVKLETAGLRFQGFTERKHHGHASIAILAVWIRTDPDAGFFQQIAAWVGAHHGRLYGRDAWESDAANPAILGDRGWRDARHELLDAVRTAWFERYPVEGRPTPPRRTAPTWLVAFGGWATLADWLGSMASCYPLDAGDDPAAYLTPSYEGAGRALRVAGLDERAWMVDPGFEKLFPFAPNALQRAMMDLPLPEDDAPSLVIVEGPTGEGKTEGAYARTARQQEHTQGNGLYVAMPTQATSNGLFPRTLDFLKHTQPGTASFRLVHGNADLHPDQEALISAADELDVLFDSDDRDPDDRLEGTVRTLRWFLPRKRGLLAPYGLGTVDQAFLGVLYARHFFLRLFALTGKTVIFDEVHAYDLYMQHLFGRLLRWLHALGAHVILLSATLPARLRTACFRAWGNATCDQDASPHEVPYPAIWLVQNGRATLEAGGFRTRWRQSAKVERRDASPQTVAEAAVEAYKAGAVTLVICNTVRRAQEVYRALPDEVRRAEDDVMLLHARYRFGIRQRREAAVLARFGKGRPNDVGGILVSTQLAEQSLDLDADVLFTDLAPIDLLLQRAGRLHRHLEARPSAGRPEGYRMPAVYWLCPEAGDSDLPDLSDIGVLTTRYTVYAPTVVWKTWALVRDRETWSLPVDYRPLIEAVYDDDIAMPSALSDTGQDTWGKGLELDAKLKREAHNQAMKQLIPEPTPSGLRNLLDPDRVLLTDEDDSDVHPSRRVLTRLGADSIEVMLLFSGDGGRLYLDSAGTEPAPLALPPGCADLPTNTVRALLQNTVRLSYEDIAQALIQRTEDDLPGAWRTATEHTAALQQLHPLVLTERSAEVAGYRITDDEVLGVCIERAS